MNKYESWALAALPVLAPIPTGYIIAAALIGHLWFWPFAVIAALALEILGYFSTKLVMSVNEHNRTLSAIERDFTASTLRAWGPLSAYILISLLLTVLLKVFDGLYIYSLGVFPFVGLLGAWVVTEWHVLTNYETAKMTARNERKQARQDARNKPQPVAKPAPEPAKVARTPITDAAIQAHLAQHPGESYTDTAAAFGVSRTAITKRIQKIYEVTK